MEVHMVEGVIFLSVNLRFGVENLGFLALPLPALERRSVFHCWMLWCNDGMLPFLYVSAYSLFIP